MLPQTTLAPSGRGIAKRSLHDAAEHGLVVTLIDDDPTFVDIIGEFLDLEMHARTLVCTRAEQAVPIVRGARPNVVLLDLVLCGDDSGLRRGTTPSSSARLRP